MDNSIKARLYDAGTKCPYCDGKMQLGGVRFPLWIGVLGIIIGFVTFALAVQITISLVEEKVAEEQHCHDTFDCPIEEYWTTTKPYYFFLFYAIPAALMTAYTLVYTSFSYQCGLNHARELERGDGSKGIRTVGLLILLSRWVALLFGMPVVFLLVRFYIQKYVPYPHYLDDWYDTISMAVIFPILNSLCFYFISKYSYLMGSQSQAASAGNER